VIYNVGCVIGQLGCYDSWLVRYLSYGHSFTIPRTTASDAVDGNKAHETSRVGEVTVPGCELVQQTLEFSDPRDWSTVGKIGDPQMNNHLRAHHV